MCNTAFYIWHLTKTSSQISLRTCIHSWTPLAIRCSRPQRISPNFFVIPKPLSQSMVWRRWSLHKGPSEHIKPEEHRKGHEEVKYRNGNITFKAITVKCIDVVFVYNLKKKSIEFKMCHDFVFNEVCFLSLSFYPCEFHLSVYCNKLTPIIAIFG